MEQTFKMTKHQLDCLAGIFPCDIIRVLILFLLYLFYLLTELCPEIFYF